MVLTLLALLVLPGTASALTDRWAQWSPVAGSANAYSGTMQQRSAGFPQATWVSDSRSNVQLPSGASAFLGPGTPPGAKYGSSANNPYLVLRPKADAASTPSTTTYTFDHPTPDTGWAFVLGDVDADAVRVSATGPNGGPLSAAQVATWFKGTFNHAGAADLPIWDPLTATLTGNAGALDTDGASGWFEPDVRLTSLTFTFTRRAGFPVYQTWFVSRARPLGGTVAAGTCAVPGATVSLVSPSGEDLGTVPVGPGGGYDLGEFATQAGYVVRLDVPPGCAAVGPVQRTLDNRGDDGSAGSRGDFTMRAIIPQPISGTVRDGGGDPVAGVEVTVTAPGGGTTTTTTGVDGTYLFDANAIDDGYSVSIAVPAGYAAGPGGTAITGIDIDADPVEDQDFVVVALPSVSGQVTGGGAGLGGVQVVLTPTGGGAPFTTVTAGDGTYDLSGVPAGDYTLSVTAPDGFAGDTSRPVTVPAGGLADEDFALTRPGAVGGQVTQDGNPVPGVTVEVDGPDAPQTLTTDDEGHYFLDGLDAGSYDITVQPPDGTEVEGADTVSVDITAAGETVGGQDFELVAAPSGTPSPTPSTDPTSSPSPTPTDAPTPSATPTTGTTGGAGGTLPDTGGPPYPVLLVGLGSLLVGLLLVALGRHRVGS